MYVSVYSTASHYAEAASIARALVDQRLAACVNVGSHAELQNVAGPITSFYRWDGEVQEGSEVGFVAKTRQSLFPEVAKTIRDLHTYDSPCILAWPIVEIDSDYARWLDAETREPEQTT